MCSGNAVTVVMVCGAVDHQYHSRKGIANQMGKCTETIIRLRPSPEPMEGRECGSRVQKSRRGKTDGNNWRNSNGQDWIGVSAKEDSRQKPEVDDHDEAFGESPMVALLSHPTSTMPCPICRLQTLWCSALEYHHHP